MTIFTLHIFTPDGVCISYTEWKAVRGEASSQPLEERHQLLYGLLLTLKGMALSFKGGKDAASPSGAAPDLPPGAVPGSMGVAPLVGPEFGCHRFATSTCAFHYLETHTGLKLVLTTDPTCVDMRPVLWHVYSTLYVGYALKNPMYTLGAPITCAGFKAELDRFIRAQPAFSA